ncbi:MAG: hypothetical protein A3B68_08455 [Candidatus Melainabacteria bacterium RIFCSPHIGHO2_02_FULL_34_12]|nr:MAG: hypothetical protein A3B68_08455 [Candidatus Melainabacteria bacterium RIFCSPHIGHO2_02_FULL_34_12]
MLFKEEQPLAYRIRPSCDEDIIGQKHLFSEPGKNGVLTNYLKCNAPYSIILWGPPGCGKTTIALLIKSNSDKEFIYLSGASTSVSELREVINKSKLMPGRIILFIDEIHRLAKNQQDVLLEVLEAGQIILIGTTTENPHISLTRALHSRVKVFELKPHIEDDLKMLIKRALTHAEGFPEFKITEDAEKLLILTSSGDGRRMLFNLEQAAKLSKNKTIDKNAVQNVLDSSQLQIGADPESHYNFISALQKSIRGSDPDAALYWLARLLSGGADPVHVARRILVTAAEDIGLADNNALNIATSAYHAAQFLGMPEARIPLAQAVIYLASAPKSNTTIISIDAAMKDATELTPYSVPLHIRNIGKEGYKYPHSYKDAKIEQEYLPEELKNRKYFEPNERDKIK